MGKLVVLKPIVWNTQRYLEPDGLVSDKGFPGEHGYGHEEWNGRFDWMWQGWKVFHTEAKGRMLTYSARGDLGIIMTAMYQGRFYAVGVACNVYLNSDSDQIDIARDLDLISNGDQLWSLDAVRKRYHDDRAAFDAHWKASCRWVRWRCPATHFLWFPSPIEIIPNDLIPGPPDKPRQAIIKMFGSYQAIRPDQALAAIGKSLEPQHPIRQWLSDGDFDDRVISKAIRNAPPPKGETGRRSAGAPTQSSIYRRYLMEMEVVITPRHHALQTRFHKYLKDIGATKIHPDLDRVDIRFNLKGIGPVLAEIKPTTDKTVRFAIRTAIGQLLDYRQATNGDPKLLIVIETEPTHADDRELALSNGFGLAWPMGGDEDTSVFEIIWPSP